MAETEKYPIWQDRIVTDPLILAGKPTIKGTRISVELVMELLDGGRSEADIIRRYSHITLKDNPGLSGVRRHWRKAVQCDLGRY